MRVMRKFVALCCLAGFAALSCSNSAGGGYSFYDWQLVNSSGESVADYSGATRNSHIGIRAGLSPGIPAGTYTLHLTVTNVKGEKFHDSATIEIY